MANPCLNCGHDVGDENPPNASHCGDCPPWRCDRCGEMCSVEDLCSCWVTFDGMNLADLKALFADDCAGPGLSIDVNPRAGETKRDYRAAEGDGRG